MLVTFSRRWENVFCVKRSLYSIDPFRIPRVKFQTTETPRQRGGAERGINEAIMTCKSSIAGRPCN